MCTACPLDPSLVPAGLWDLPLFHGTSSSALSLGDLSVLDRPADAASRSWHADLGLHLTPHHPTARAFAGGGTVLAARLSCLPGEVRVFRDEFSFTLAAALFHLACGRSRPAGWDAEDSRSDHSWLTGALDADVLATGFRDHLLASGVRVVVYGNEVEGPYLHPCVVVLDPSALKADRSHPPHAAGAPCDLDPSLSPPSCPVLQYVTEARAALSRT